MLYTTCGTQRRSKKEKNQSNPETPKKKSPLASVWCFKFVHSFFFGLHSVSFLEFFCYWRWTISGTFFKFNQCSFCILTIGYMIALLQGMHLLITHALDLGLVVCRMQFWLWIGEALFLVLSRVCRLTWCPPYLCY